MSYPLPQPPASSPVAERLALALELVDEAAAITTKYFLQDGLSVDVKADDSPVTIADRQAEERLRECIAQRFPHDGLIGEEFGTEEGASGFSWTLDPIDGTKSFVAGVPLYTTLIAVLQEGEAVAGVLDAPAAGETLFAGPGTGTWHRHRDAAPKQVKVSGQSDLSRAALLTTDVKAFRADRHVDALPAFIRLQDQVRLSRTWGDAFGYLLVATGRADIMIDPGLHIWDVGPLIPIIQEAGGRITDWQGGTGVGITEGVATNGKLHAAVLGVLGGQNDV